MKRIVKDPQDLTKLLENASSSLADFSNKTNSLKILTNIVRQICPDLPENAWQIANFHNDLVVIEANSPVWGQRLQFERNNIASQLETQTNGIFNKIEIKINPFTNRRAPIIKPQTEKLKHMSDASSAQIAEVAKNAPPGLKEKLLKLAQHANRNKNQS
ncbi:DUF721 domain-containing protein [Thalassotalea aquiviva]|uniref:DUF721 domain-containing protein n=1 Tax=Thalassotalea aquiviva TaxID=3242415 RepID=UPI003529E869